MGCLVFASSALGRRFHEGFWCWEGLGTDYPFDMGVTDPVERAAAAGPPAADLTAILSGNAAALFSLSAAVGRQC